MSKAKKAEKQSENQRQWSSMQAAMIMHDRWLFGPTVKYVLTAHLVKRSWLFYDGQKVIDRKPVEFTNEAQAKFAAQHLRAHGWERVVIEKVTTETVTW